MKRFIFRVLAFSLIIAALSACAVTDDPPIGGDDLPTPDASSEPSPIEEPSIEPSAEPSPEDSEPPPSPPEETPSAEPSAEPSVKPSPDIQPPSPSPPKETPSLPDIDPAVQMLDNIANRNVIDETYLSLISNDTGLTAMLREYNEQTQILTDFFFAMAASVICAVEMIEDGNGLYATLETVNYMDLPPNVREMIETVTRFSLYRNCAELFLSDPKLAEIIDREAGGSAGMWPYTWHTFYLSDEMKTALEEYFTLVEDIAGQLEMYTP